MDNVNLKTIPIEEIRGSYNNLNVYIEPPAATRSFVLLDEVKTLTSHLQRTLDAVARNLNSLSESDKTGIDYYIVEAKIGSLGFSILAAPTQGSIDPNVVMATFTEDLKTIHSRHYRPTLSPDLLKSYKGLVRALGESHTQISYTYNQTQVVIDDVFRGAFEFAARDRRAGVLSVVGKIEGLNAHRSPHFFSLYPKLNTSVRIECRFPHGLLGVVADNIKHKRLVEVTGEAYFAPVGIYPTLIEVTTAPSALDYNPTALRQHVRSLALVPSNMTAGEFLQQNREVAGIEE